MAERATDLFALVDRPARSTPKVGRFGWVAGAIPALVLLCTLAPAVWLPAGIPGPARLALFAFGASAILWTLTELNGAYVALGAALFLVVTGAVGEDALFGALSSDVVWLLIGTFIAGRAFEASGLAARMTAALCRGAGTVGALSWRLALGLVPLTFVIPSTSGQAAATRPLLEALASASEDKRITRAFALLIPAVLLVSTISSLVGAGSHLIANDLLSQLGGERIGFGRWILYGLPFGIAASVATAAVISRLYLTAEQRRRPLAVGNAAPTPVTSAEWRAGAITTVMVALWITNGSHPLGIALVAVIGGFALTTPGLGAISWKTGLKAVNWNLILFVGAALVLGEALISTGAAKWLVGRVVDASGFGEGGSPLFTVLALAFVSLTSHLYFASHSARAAAMLPPLLILANSAGLKPAAVMFIATVGMDYCLTFPFSSKALAVFQEVGGEPTWSPPDLLKLSAVMLPVHAGLIVAFYFGYWQYVGLEL